MRLSPDEVQKFCQVNPIDMLLGTDYCYHGNDCANCQYLIRDLYVAEHGQQNNKQATMNHCISAYR